MALALLDALLDATGRTQKSLSAREGLAMLCVPYVVPEVVQWILDLFLCLWLIPFKGFLLHNFCLRCNIGLAM